MPRYSLRTLIAVMTLGGPLLAALIVRPVTLIYLLLAAPTILAVLVTCLLALVFLGLGLMHLANRCRQFASQQAPAWELQAQLRAAGERPKHADPKRFYRSVDSHSGGQLS